MNEQVVRDFGYILSGPVEGAHAQLAMWLLAGMILSVIGFGAFWFWFRSPDHEDREFMKARQREIAERMVAEVKAAGLFDARPGEVIRFNGGTHIAAPLIPGVPVDRWAEFHRDCLDLDMDLQAFADKWHGKVPKKPAPVAMNGGWYLGGERIGNVCSHNAVAHECQKCHEIAFNACALQRRYDEAKAKLTEKRRRIIEETEAMLVTPPPPPPVGTHTLRHEANKPGSYKLACSGPGCVRCKRPDQYTYEWMP